MGKLHPQGGRPIKHKVHARRAKTPIIHWSEEQESAFFKALSRRGILRDGIAAAGPPITRDVVRWRRENEAEFEAKVLEAIDESNDTLMTSLWDRGVTGNERTRELRGGGSVKEVVYDTPAVQLLMRYRMPNLFGRIELTGKDGRDIKIKVVE